MYLAAPLGSGDPFFGYPADIRKVIYTTNAIESVNMSLCKVTKNRGSLPSDGAITKLFYQALHNIAKKWIMPTRDWKAALNQFSSRAGCRSDERETVYTESFNPRSIVS